MIQQRMMTRLVLGLMPILGIPACAAGQSRIAAVWANSGEDKVTRHDLRASKHGKETRNACWDGRSIRLFAGRNETVAFNLVIEAGQETVQGVQVELSSLTGPAGNTIASRAAEPETLFDFVDRNIELFHVGYLQIRGLSTLAYEHYDERHVPLRMRRPHDQGKARGGWNDRPDHDQFYPEIAVPLELRTPFGIEAATNQSIWVDIYVPKSTAPGTYQGRLTIREQARTTRQIPVRLQVLSFTLPDLPAARTMVYVSNENVNRRYLGERYPEPGTPLHRQSLAILDRHFQIAHRHRLSLIDDYLPIDRLGDAWIARLDGSLFSRQRGYDGPGSSVGNNVYSIGTFGSWPWREGTQREMWSQSDTWVQWFDEHRFKTPTDYFLYLIDESADYPQIEQWSQWVDANPGPGRRLLTLATLPAPRAIEHAPSLDIVASTSMAGIRDEWQAAIEQYRRRGRAHLILYNGWRPASGCFVTEDDGVALRELAWGQYKLRVPRWFVWESTYYNNFQGGLGETNVFQRAHVFGGHDRVDAELGETGSSYNNGDGVLFYPGTDRVFPDENLNLAGPLVSLRLKHWRRGLQDVDYLVMAARANRSAVNELVNRMVPKVLWELEADDHQDPTWVSGDISWSTDPDVWEDARRKLAELIEQGPASPRN